MDNTLVLKLAVLVPMFLLTLIAGVIPIKCPCVQKNEKILGLLSAFSGGVFLAIALIHIIPETTHLYHFYMLDKNPLPEEGAMSR